jgi:hypothetical protein
MLVLLVGYMNGAVQMGSGGMMYVSSIIKLGSPIRVTISIRATI